MFTTNAGVYYVNAVFRAKMVMLLLAGINMAVFELTTGRLVDQWDGARSAPLADKTAAVISLVFWITIIFFGRWIGLTTLVRNYRNPTRSISKICSGETSPKAPRQQHLPK